MEVSHMLGLLFLILCYLVGFTIISFFIPNLEQITEKAYTGKVIRLPAAFYIFPAAYTTGCFLMTWATYLSSYALNNLATQNGMDSPLIYGNLVTMILACILIAIGSIYHIKKESFKKIRSIFAPFRPCDCVYAVLALAISCFLMYYTFYVKGNTLNVGSSVHGDFSAHLAMIRSFSFSNNFPTQYPHYAGEDIRYHFLFQFMVGNLEYLGLRIDHAFNIPSILNFFHVLLLLYCLAVKITGKKFVACLSGFFFLARSSSALFQYLGQYDTTISGLKALLENTTYIGTTPNESWGLWNLNVYANQRHFALGISMLLVVVILYVQPLYTGAKRTAACIRESNGKIFLPFKWFRHSWLSMDGWRIESLRTAIFAGILIGACSFINGACTIAVLLVLFFIALASDRKVEYLILAIISVFLSFLASSFFINGSATQASFFFGFIAEHKSLFGVLNYLLTLTGIFVPVLLAAFTLEKNANRWLIVSFSAPIAQGFTLSLTRDVAVNHKYIMMGMMLCGIFLAVFVDWLWNKRKFMTRFVSIILILCMTATGLYDFYVLIRQNNSKTGLYSYKIDSSVTEWAKENSDSSDLWLTDTITLNELVLAGVMLYYGYPYLGWSAGYDTDSRNEKVIQMYEAETPSELRTLVEAEGIDYIVIDVNNRSAQWYTLNEENIRNTYECVFDDTETIGDPNWSTVIFDTSKPL